MTTRKTRVINITILLLIFAGGVIFHYLYGAFSKSIEVLPDEIRYYSIARSIFEGDGLTFRGLPTDYQKMGYTLLLIPFFLIGNGILRMKAITFLNCVLMMSGIFPLSGIMNKLELSSKIRYVALVCFIFFPDLMYSATFMAEVLYYPLLLLFVYLWLLNRDKKSIVLSILLGVVAYAGYMTKEIFLAVILSIVAFEIFYPILEYLVNKKSNYKKLKSYYNKKLFINTVIVCVVFVVLHIAVKLLFFAGLGNSYNQMGIEVIDSVDKILYLLYGFVYYVAAALIATLAISFLLPGFVYNQLNDSSRQLYIFNIFCILASIATVAYTITVREDYPEIIPRTHFRYLGPYFIIAVTLLLVVITAKYIKLKMSKSVVITGILTLLITFVVFRGIRVVTGVDQFILDWTYSITSNIPGRLGLFVINAVVAIVTVTIAVLVATEHRSIALVISIVIMLGLGIFNTVTAKDRVVEYMYRDEEMVQDAININEYLQGTDGEVLYIADYGGYEDRCKCIDTFVDKNDKLLFTTYHMTDNMSEGTANVSDISIPMQFNLWEMSYNDIDNIEYIIMNNNNESLGLDFDNLTKIDSLSGKYYTVYKNNNPSTIVLSKPKEYK